MQEVTGVNLAIQISGTCITILCLVIQAMASPEDKAYEIMRELDVDYVLVIFGGLTGYSSDGKLLYCFIHFVSNVNIYSSLKREGFSLIGSFFIIL